jgi:hypothetical protein
VYDNITVFVKKVETNFRRKLSKYIERVCLLLFGTVIATLEKRILYLDWITIQIISKVPAIYGCGISGRGENKRGLASSALNQTKLQRVFINFALIQ